MLRMPLADPGELRSVFDHRSTVKERPGAVMGLYSLILLGGPLAIKCSLSNHFVRNAPNVTKSALAHLIMHRKLDDIREKWYQNVGFIDK